MQTTTEFPILFVRHRTLGIIVLLLVMMITCSPATSQHQEKKKTDAAASLPELNVAKSSPQLSNCIELE